MDSTSILKNMQLKITKFEYSQQKITSKQTILYLKNSRLVVFLFFSNKKEGSRKETRKIWQMKLHDAKEKTKSYRP